MENPGAPNLRDLNRAFPLRPAQNLDVTNTNTGSGAQTNSTQSGGYANQQWNASTINNYITRPETPPYPHLILPFTRDPNFVDRAELTLLEQKLETTNRVALVGLGGIGKSQLAIEYCYRVRDRSPDTWILWLHASNAARFEESMISLADNVKIPGRKDETNDVLQLVQSWLNDPSKGKWVLVLDNVDDVDFLDARCCRSNKGKRHIDYLPTSSHGSMIITSRDTEVARGLVDDDDTISLSSMTEEAALTLLKSRVGQITNSELEDASELVTALEYMPLAIAQAGSSIKRRAPRYSIKRYLADLKKSDNLKARLLSADMREPRRDREARNSIFATWQISFEHILHVQPSAADLLSLMSFFDYQGIPDFLLQAACRVSKADNHKTSDNGSDASAQDHFGIDSQSDSEFEADFDADIEVLRDYDLLSVSPDGALFEMHRLVQLATQHWLKNGGRHEAFAAQSVRGLDTVLPFPDDSYGNWETHQLLYPHAKLVLQSFYKMNQARLQLASVAYKAGWFMIQKRSLDEAESFMARSLGIRMESLGQNSVEVLWTQNGLAFLLRLQGKYSAAEQLYKTSLETHEKLFGRDPAYLWYCIDMGLTLKSERKHDEAEKLYRDIIQAREETFGRQDVLVVRSLAGLSEVLASQGKFEEAETSAERVLTWHEERLGQEDPRSLECVSNLATVLTLRGKFDEAERMACRVLESRAKVLGKDHPDTWNSLRELSWLRCQQASYEEAEELALRALEAFERRCGLDHHRTMRCLDILASIWSLQRKYEDAEKMDRRRLIAHRRLDGEDHPDTLRASEDLAQDLQDLGRYQEAFELIHSCVEMSRRVFGPDHKDTKRREDLVLDLEDKLKVSEASDSGWEADSGSDVTN